MKLQTFMTMSLMIPPVKSWMNWYRILMNPVSVKWFGFQEHLQNWKQEIINSFIIVDYEYKVDKGTGRVAVQPKKMNNAIIENKNSIIKTIKKNANGYTNWNRFRNRIMYVLDTEATFRAEPLSLSKSKSSQWLREWSAALQGCNSKQYRNCHTKRNEELTWWWVLFLLHPFWEAT